MQGWRLSPEHFVERDGLIVIIALGESIVAIGVGAAGLPLHAGLIVAALLGIAVAASLWWSYFDWVAYVAPCAWALLPTRRSAIADARAWIRSRRGAFTMEEAARVARTPGSSPHPRA